MNSIDEVRKVSEVSSEATYLLPKDSTDRFPEFFKEFDERLEELKVNSYGVSMATLEEVFLKVENSGKEEHHKAIERIKKRMTSECNQDQEYTISKEQVEGVLNVFFLHTWALLIKRFILTKRNIKGLIMDIIVPFVLLLSGSWFVTVDHYKNSAQRILEPNLFPLDQRVIYNSYNVGGRNSADLMDLLDPSSNFTISDITTSGSTERENLINFDNQIYNASLVNPLSPSRFGHYYFNFLDYTNHQYEVATFFNSTSQDAHVAFPHFMYGAILKKSISSSFNYTMINDPMPIVDVFQDQIRGLDSLFLLLLYAVALALIPASIIGFLVNEKSTNLTHQQTISGMNKAAYWVSNYIFDITRVFVPILIAIALLYIFDIAYSYAWLLLLLFPFAIVPYTYVTSFLFSEDAPAQNFTIIHHMIIAGIFPIILFILRLNESMEGFGDHIRWIFRLVPSYNTVGGISSIAIKDYIANNRQETPPSPFSFDVAGADLVFLFVHMIVWPCLLILIELGVFNFLRKKDKNAQVEQDELDNDVEAERFKVEQTTESELAVRANHLRKVFGDKVAVKDISFTLEFGD